VTAGITKISRNGQVVIPKAIRDRLSLQPGDSLVATEVDGKIVLAPTRKRVLRQEFNHLMGEFDRVLRGVRVSEDEIVRIVRRVRRSRRSPVERFGAHPEMKPFAHADESHEP
jgi:AbrB family looped-hinge helix DNA binding protein